MPEKDMAKNKPIITDLTFFTNEPDQTLLDRFKVTIEHNKCFFDALVGFFKTSGFFKLFPYISKSNQQPFITLVDHILSAKQKDPSADTSALEKQINNLAYILYNLTPEEIAIVEGKR